MYKKIKQEQVFLKAKLTITKNLKITNNDYLTYKDFLELQMTKLSK